MKKTLLAFCISLAPLFAFAQASKESIEKLLEVTQTRRLVEQMHPQMETLMKSAMAQSIDMKRLSPQDQQKAQAYADALMKKMALIMREQMEWEKIKAIYLPIYRESFTQEEIDGLIQFYTTPAGRALVEKMPIVMQKSMVVMQQRMAPIMQEFQKAVAETAKEFKSSPTQ